MGLLSGKGKNVREGEGEKGVRLEIMIIKWCCIWCGELCTEWWFCIYIYILFNM